MRWLIVRRIALILGLLVVVVLIWYATSRLRGWQWSTSIEEVPAVPGQAPNFDGTLRLAAYNIAHARGPVLGTSNWDGGSEQERRRRLAAIGSHLGRLGIDLVVLNEIDFSCTWSHGIDQARVIAEAGGFRYLARQTNYELSLPFFRLWFGNAVLSHYPITAAQIRRFAPYSRSEALLFGNHDSLLTTIQLSDQCSLRLWAVHLEFRSERSRLAAVRRIDAEFGQSPLLPVVIAGDFNSTRRGLPRYDPVPGQGSAIDHLLDSGRYQAMPPGTPAATEMTFPALQPDRAIDWIMVTGGPRIVDGGVDAQTLLSDHRLVHATIAID
jgi:endonuclease/exonuclease/phosphatase family metal-dependent hydrolase